MNTIILGPRGAGSGGWVTRRWCSQTWSEALGPSQEQYLALVLVQSLPDWQLPAEGREGEHQLEKRQPHLCVIFFTSIGRELEGSI